MQHGSVIIPSISHRIHVRTVVQQQQHRINVTVRPNRAHQWRNARPVTGLRTGTVRKQQLQAFHIGGEIDFRAEKVPLVRIGTTIEQQPGHLVVFVAQRQPQRFVAERGARVRIVGGLAVIDLAAGIEQRFGEL